MNTTQVTNAQFLWTSISESIKQHVPENSFAAWLADIQPIKIDDTGKTLILAVPNELTRGWIQNRYQTILTSELIKINPCLKNIKLTLARRTHKKSQPPLSQKSVNLPLDMPTLDDRTNLNPELSFENFIVSPYNRFAYSAAKATLESCGILYNPLYLYGPTGVGKTHLLQAICNRAKQINPKLNIYYISSETFIEDYINSVKTDRVSEFRLRFQQYQMIAIDDAQFFKKSEAVLVELFHVFNHLINKNAQIIISSDKPPSELEGVQDRIRTRLSSGLVLDLQNPQREDICIICKELSSRIKLMLTDEAIEYIADNVEKNIREIHGSLKNIHLNTIDQRGVIIGIDATKKFIKNRVKINPNATPEEVINVVCSHYQIKKELLGTKIRRQEVVLARQMAMYIFREYFNMSYTYIGRHFGNRDHTTVIHSYEKINKNLNKDIRVQKDLEAIKNQIDL